MAKKITYRHRNAEKLAGENDGFVQPQVKQERKPVDTALQLPYIEGKVILIDKPLHWTSFDVIRKLKNILQIKKIGHAGTLDPLATGLLIVCTGKFTKKINEFMAAEKEYTGTITLGAVTPTYDLESNPEQFKDYNLVTNDQILAATRIFTGVIQQLPPIYSAIKKDGVALYELARRGDTVKLEARTVTISSFEITKVEMPVVTFRVVCSTGTYIRSLANDFGALLGCGGYLSSLRRERIGDSDVKNAMQMEAFQKNFEIN